LVAVIDLEHCLILNIVTLPAILLALGGPLFDLQLGYRSALLGGVLGFALACLIYLLGALFVALLERWRGRSIDEVAFGDGDVKLATFIGLVTGFPGIIFALLIAILVGGIVAALLLVVKAVFQRRYVPFMVILYGPFLIFLGIAMMLYGRKIVEWCLGG
jgi:leader peptidase (prepilin peptidase)/N-methyltransferase